MVSDIFRVYLKRSTVNRIFANFLTVWHLCRDVTLEIKNTFRSVTLLFDKHPLIKILIHSNKFPRIFILSSRLFSHFLNALSTWYTRGVSMKRSRCISIASLTIPLALVPRDRFEFTEHILRTNNEQVIRSGRIRFAATVPAEGKLWRRLNAAEVTPWCQ